MRLIETKQLEEEIIERQTVAGELRLIDQQTRFLAEERQKLLRAYYANAIPRELLKRDQDRITEQEEKARVELAETEADLHKRQEVLTIAIRLAGSCGPTCGPVKAPRKIIGRGIAEDAMISTAPV